MKKVLPILVNVLLLLSLLCYFVACNASPTCYATFTVDGEAYEKIEFTQGSSVSFPQPPTKEGYEFLGWFNGDSLISDLRNQNGDIELTAKFELITYTATFIADDQTVEELPFSVETMSIEAPEVPEKQCHTGVWEEYTLSPQDIVIHAVYTSAHTDTIHVDKVDPQCNLTGTVEHWKCSDCNTLFSDPDCKTEIYNVTSDKVDCVYVNNKCKWCEAPQPSEGLAYTVNGNSATITGIGSCRDKNVTVPSKIDGYTVTAIGERAFAELTELTAVRLPDTVTTLGNRVFYGCTGLTEITVPASVTSIGTQIFYKATNLTTVYYNSSYSSKYNLFFSESNVQKIIFGGETVPSYICKNCTDLTEIKILPTVTSIGYYSFENCSMTTVHITDIDKWCRITFNSYPLNSAQKLYLNGEPLKEVIIPEGVKQIYPYAFAGCSSLTSVVIPSSVTSIGTYAFANCYTLESIVIPDKVTSISSYAFSGCNNMKSIAISDNVKNLGEYAFSGCNKLTSIVIPNNVTSIGNCAFLDCGSLKTVVIGNSVTSIGQKAFYGCRNLTSVTIGANVTSIGTYAFYGCSSLTSITIPYNVTSIGASAFAGCSALSSVTFEDPDNWKVLKNYVYIPNDSIAAKHLTSTYYQYIWLKS